ncbi:SGNH/GDSL hydrolase family protein [Maritalea sp.]|uniref:SGNH/GDSL hydrolase family protein n=1 Tax=Maritalea sp. TaxID=2003361 RepID=UPI003EF40C3C
MRRWAFKLLMVVVLMLAFAPATIVNIGIAQERIEVAQAEKQKRRTLFDVLFGRNKPEEKKKTAPVKKTTKRKSSPSITSVPKIKMIEKAPDARTLLVVGDSLAIDLAKALDRHYAKDTQLAIVSKGVGSSGFVRDDYFDWNKAIETYLTSEEFDMVVVAVGINDRQEIRASNGRHKPLTDGWRTEYEQRLSSFLRALSEANKPVVWMGLPPMSKRTYSKAMSQITSLHRLAAFANGAEYVDIYERFADEDGNYTAYGPDLNGQNKLMRKGDGIHLSSAGSDKAAFFIDKVIKQFYRGGEISVAIIDPLAGTDVAGMLRPPFQGVAQVRKLELAGAVRELGEKAKSSGGLVLAQKSDKPNLSLTQLFAVQPGRADGFGVSITPVAEPDLRTIEQ